ncbi:hypothetical protein PoB_005648500 [Plakobranchus ocellatus]|uniref:Uncharacterized protein n=1 Tax=Plakobranchus ocellatus TaxID=259542 RepID=A0AAV4CB61_9GAST|nr:hypothetical protein PoB_005648500 [Plakobranchus ocellatus]
MRKCLTDGINMRYLLTQASRIHVSAVSHLDASSLSLCVSLLVCPSVPLKSSRACLHWRWVSPFYDSPLGKTQDTDTETVDNEVMSRRR